MTTPNFEYLYCDNCVEILSAACGYGGTIRILENRAFGSQATCKHDGTLKTGGIVWDAAHCLVHLMGRLGPTAFRGKSVLELGAGCGYVGIAAAKMGAVVTVSDRVDHLEHLQDNVARNRLEHCMRVTELEWAQHDTDAFRRRCSAPFDWILASDCVYEEDSHGPLARTVSAFSDASTLVLMSQECRSEVHTSFFRRATPSSYDGAQRRDSGGGEEEDACMDLSIRLLDDRAYERPAWCHQHQHIQIFCLMKGTNVQGGGLGEGGVGAEGGGCGGGEGDASRSGVGEWENMTFEELQQRVSMCHERRNEKRERVCATVSASGEQDLDELD